MAGQALFIGRCEMKPSTEGWHILRAFWKLSSNVRPIAMTCKGEHIHMSYSETSLAVPRVTQRGKFQPRRQAHRNMAAFGLLPKIILLAVRCS